MCTVTRNFQISLENVTLKYASFHSPQILVEITFLSHAYCPYLKSEEDMSWGIVPKDHVSWGKAGVHTPPLLLHPGL